MALRFPTQVTVGAGRSGGQPVGVYRVPVAASSFGPSADSFGGIRKYQGGAVCLHGPVLKSRLSDVRQQESLSSATSSGSWFKSEEQPFKEQKETHPTQRRTGVSGNEAHPNPNADSWALIDIEENDDGCITFKYGAVEDLWELDRLLEFLASGAFGGHTAESFVRVVVELFRVPVSRRGQQRMVDLLLSQIRLHSGERSMEIEKTVSQVLAEAVSEFLPPSSVGSYCKGSVRPYQRFSSLMDKWWKRLDNYLGVGEGSVDFVPKHGFEGLWGYPMHWSESFEKLDPFVSYEPFKPKFSRSGSTSPTTTQFTWDDPPSQMPWLTRLSDRLCMEPPKTSTLEFVRESETSARPGGPGGGECVSGLDFIMVPSSRVDVLEDAVRKTEVVEESTPEPDLHFARPFRNVDTLPIGSIQAMLEWEQEEVFVTSVGALPSKPKSRVKSKTSKKTAASATQHAKRKTDPTLRGSTRSHSKKKSTVERQTQAQLIDMFFDLPISHKCSGVASFLAMRKNFGGEMLAVLNQVSVGFAGVGVAVTLHVVARMLSVNSTFDCAKLFGLIRGVALVVLSAAMHSVRKVMLRLPAGCTVADSKDKTDVLCLQQRLRRLSLTVMSVMVLTVVGQGFK